MKRLKEFFDSNVKCSLVMSIAKDFSGLRNSNIVLKDNIQNYAHAINSFNEFLVNNKEMMADMKDISLSMSVSLPVDLGDFHMRHDIEPASLNELNKIMNLTLPEYIEYSDNINPDNENSYAWTMGYSLQSSEPSHIELISDFASFDFPLLVHFNIRGTTVLPAMIKSNNIKAEFALSLETQYVDKKKIKKQFLDTLKTSEKLRKAVKLIGRDVYGDQYPVGDE